MKTLSAVAIALAAALLALGCASRTAGAPAREQGPANAKNVRDQGNGSSGIGNFVPIVPGVTARMATADSVRIADGTVIDGKTGEALLFIEKIPQAAPPPGEIGQWVPSVLGAVNGYEYLPVDDTSADLNFWVVPARDGNLYKLSPLSSTNPKVLAVIGSLDFYFSGEFSGHSGF